MNSHGLSTLEDLHRRSVADPTWFWDAVVKDLDLEFYRPYEKVLDLSDGMPWAHWFVGGQYNYVHNALDRHASSTSAGRLALTWEGEDGATRRLTFAELLEATNRLANGLHQLGVGKGDRVGIYMPMTPEAVVATLAVGKLGAIYIPIFSGYAAPSVASRLSDSGAKVLITSDGFYRRGKIVDMGSVAVEATKLSPSVEKVVMFHRINAKSESGAETIVNAEALLVRSDSTFVTVRTAANDPYMLIYTSGTTGRPKGAVHVHAGFPIKATQDLAHCFDLQSDDTLFWLTDLGWMMGPWAIAGGLTLGATLCLFEGAIDFPGPDRLWQIVERHRATLLGVSPTAVRALMTHGDGWAKGRDLSSLRAFGSTGEPWNADPWWWLFRTVGGERLPILNYSGGTEVSGGIVGGFTIAPSRPCSFAGPVPGMAADVVDENGLSVRGAVGELVLRQPWVGMTQGFWQDSRRYLDTYWSRWPDVWVHGDWARIDQNGSWYILGRSDDTIKLAGKRVGPAEVESAAVSHFAVAEAVAIGVPDDVKGEALVVLIVLRSGFEGSDPLREEIRATVTRELGRALRPEKVSFVAELPRTRNGKILRRLAKGTFLGISELGDTSALENPSALDAIRGAT